MWSCCCLATFMSKLVDLPVRRLAGGARPRLSLVACVDGRSIQPQLLPTWGKRLEVRDSGPADRVGLFATFPVTPRPIQVRGEPGIAVRRWC